ncbi:MAG: hypothetical protein GXP49_15000 [Deltaproteobacteria bacterium]|nr:hypothetical protein [Deltaproteobacteria bacterium]
MIAKQWITPTRNLFAQMLRGLARTHAAGLAVKNGQRASENRLQGSDDEAVTEGEQAGGAGETGDKEKNYMTRDETNLDEHPDLAALIHVASMAGIKDMVIRKAWEMGLGEGRSVLAALLSGAGVTPEISVAPVSDKPGICAVSGCNEPAKVKGLCVRHYRKMRYAESRRSMGLEYRPRSGGESIHRTSRQFRGPTIPQYTLDILREIGAPMTIDRICELVRSRAKDIELPEPRVLRARVRHFLYTSPKTERAGRGTFQIKGGAKRVLRRPAGGIAKGIEGSSQDG